MRTEQQKTPFNILQVLRGVVSAFFGVQSSQQGDQDFKHGHLGWYIAVALILAGLFVFTLWSVVQFVLS